MAILGDIVSYQSSEGGKDIYHIISFHVHGIPDNITKLWEKCQMICREHTIEVNFK